MLWLDDANLKHDTTADISQSKASACSRSGMYEGDAFIVYPNVIRNE